jgi:hypothetical protein
MSSHYIRIQTTLVFWGASPIISDCVRSFVSKRRVCVTVCVTVCVPLCVCVCVSGEVRVLTLLWCRGCWFILGAPVA